MHTPMIRAKPSLLGLNSDVAVKDKGLYELTDYEKDLVRLNAGLGIGAVIRANEAPKITNMKVIKDLKFSELDWVSEDQVRKEVTIASTARAAAYSKGGWGQLSVSGSTPWVSGSAEISFKASSGHSESGSTLHVTGQYRISKCIVIIPPYLLAPHPEFEKAVKAALESPDLILRSKALSEVFNDWGHIFVSSVEMGGAKYVTTKKTVTKTTSHSDLEVGMKISMGKKLGVGKVGISAAGGIETSEEDKNAETFENLDFDTQGGSSSLDDYNEWAASVSESYNKWFPTQKLQVRSVISLFSKEIQAKIIEAQPAEMEKVPLYGVRHKKEGRHFYSTNATNCDKMAVWDYLPSRTAAKILPFQVETTIPLYHLWSKAKVHHLYTASETRRTELLNGDFQVEGIEGYVFKEPVPGTVPLYRLCHPLLEDDVLITGLAACQEKVDNWGYKLEEIVGYAFEA